MKTFYNGLTNANRAMIDAAAGGTLMRKTLEKAYELLEEMVLNVYQWQSNWPKKRIHGIHSIDVISALSVQIEASSRKIDKLNTFSIDYQVNDSFVHYSDQANFVGNFQGYNNFQGPHYNPP